VFTEEQIQTLVSLRTSYALTALPGLWDKLPGASADGVSVADGLAVASQLADADPWARVRLHLRIARGLPLDADPRLDLRTPTAEELRAAAAATAAGAYPLNRALLLGSEMLQEPEKRRLEELAASKKQTAGEILAAELRPRTLGQRALRRLRGAPKMDDGATLEAIGAADTAEAGLFAAMSSEVDLHLGLTRALYSYHDRLATRRRRGKNALKGTGAFVAFNLLDFTITNI